MVEHNYDPLEDECQAYLASLKHAYGTPPKLGLKWEENPSWSTQERINQKIASIKSNPLLDHDPRIRVALEKAESDFNRMASVEAGGLIDQAMSKIYAVYMKYKCNGDSETGEVLTFIYNVYWIISAIEEFLMGDPTGLVGYTLGFVTV